MNYVKSCLIITMLLGALYSQCNEGYSECNESNWEEYYPDMQGCYLLSANFVGADLSGANLDGACLEGAINCTQTNYNGTPILEGCADTWG